MQSSVNLRGQLVAGRYLVEEWLASGSFGDIYRARQTQLRRSVALKLLRREWRRERRVIDRFQAEAAAAASVDHSNVVEIFDFGESGGRLYLAMELLRGTSLQTRLDARLRPSEKIAVSLCCELLDALDAAHGAGIIHGDVKPSNVILHRRGGIEMVKLIDFGAASPVDAAAVDPGNLMGTPSYMAPELARGGAPSVSTDLYAVGAVLFELVFGRPPFTSDSTAEVLRLQCQAPLVRPPSGHCSEEVWAVMKRALAKDPAERYASAAEMRSELASSPRPAPSRSAPQSLSDEIRDEIGEAIEAGDFERVASLYLDLADLLAGMGQPWRALGELEEAADVVTAGEGLFGDAGPAKAWAIAVRMAELERDVCPKRALAHARAGLRRALLAKDQRGIRRARELVGRLVPVQPVPKD